MNALRDRSAVGYRPTRGPRRRLWTGLVLVLTVVSTVGAAPPNGKQDATQVFVAPYDSLSYLPSPYATEDRNAETCDDGGGTLVCTVSAHASWKTGDITASAALERAEPLPATGRAFAYGYVGEMLKLQAGYSRLDITAEFLVRSAEATTSFGSASSVRAYVYVRHDRCEDCEISVNRFVVSSQNGVSQASVSDVTVPLEVVVTGPNGGEVPRGQLWIWGGLDGVVDTYGQMFDGTVFASVDGHLSSITVEYKK